MTPQVTQLGNEAEEESIFKASLQITKTAISFKNNIINVHIPLKIKCNMHA